MDNIWIKTANINNDYLWVPPNLPDFFKSLNTYISEADEDLSLVGGLKQNGLYCLIINNISSNQFDIYGREIQVNIAIDDVNEEEFRKIILIYLQNKIHLQNEIESLYFSYKNNISDKEFIMNAKLILENLIESSKPITATFPHIQNLIINLSEESAPLDQPTNYIKNIKFTPNPGIKVIMSDFMPHRQFRSADIIITKSTLENLDNTEEESIFSPHNHKHTIEVFKTSKKVSKSNINQASLGSQQIIVAGALIAGTIAGIADSIFNHSSNKNTDNEK